MHSLTRRIENRLDTHDVAIPLIDSTNPSWGNTESSRQLRVLLLAPSWTLENNLSTTLDRIHHFASLTGGQDLAIVFLLNQPKTSSFISVKDLTSTNTEPEAGTKGILAYAQLQSSLLPRDDIPHIPVLPLASVDGLPGLLTKYAAALSRKPQPVPPTTSPFEMLQFSTLEPPMDRATAYFATDCFHDLRDLAVASCTEPAAESTSSSPSFGVGEMSQSCFAGHHGRHGFASQRYNAGEGLRQLRGLVGEQRYGELVEFWLDEWVVEE
jgi:hypothetical protein